jgi:hypothetical protein
VPVVDKIKAQAHALIKPQLEILAREFQDACKKLRFESKRPEWEITQEAEKAVHTYVDALLRIVSESIEKVIRTKDEAPSESIIQLLFSGLIPDISQIRAFVYQTLSGFGIPGTPGIGIELDNAYRLGTDSGRAKLQLLSKPAGERRDITWERDMTRKRDPEPVPPSLPYDKAHAALKRQLAELEKLKGRNYAQAESDETEWQHFTQSIIERTFGNPSSNLTKYYGARSAGSHNLYGVDTQQMQVNFESRAKEFESLLRSLLSELELYLPEERIKGVYETGDEYGFYRDLSSLVAGATSDVFIVDAYLDESVFNLYVEKIPSGVNVRMLSNKISSRVETIAEMYAKGKPLELRSSSSVHDRAVFVDQRGWVVGQSIKDAAKNKPTYMVELGEPNLTASRKVHDSIWSSAKTIV